ncbi:hypothetical protein C8R45DRAFT_904567 [Mycena sanguinolenta]|nr:hypothetical protein C8R45DRAFT_904567 [Mycena sanguinolenta]
MPQIDVAPDLLRNPSSASTQDTLFTQSTTAETGPFFPGMTSVPPEHPARTLVLCFDGTGNQFDLDNSNIVEFFSMLSKADRTKQMVYYQAGIGTYTTPEIATPFWANISMLLDTALAFSLHAHVIGGYEFLMQNYMAGDRICIFGFSRGAYTARSLAGMLHKVGLLPVCNHQQVPFAYKMFTRTDDIGWQQSNAFKKAFSIDVPIEFIGVWDTVNSVGLIPKRLPFTTSNTIVRTFRHAVSLDERRAKFKPNLWNRPNADEQLLSISDQQQKPQPQHDTKLKRNNTSQRVMEASYDEGRDSARPTDIEEVFFAGCHCDVGGGSVANDTQHSLARIPLRWMVRECFKTNTGIMFDPEGLRGIGLDPDALYPVVKPRPAALSAGSGRILVIPRAPWFPTGPAANVTKNGVDIFLTEEELDLRDALSPIYDQLNRHWLWWLLELMPLRQRTQRADDSWEASLVCNWGRGREIPKHHELKVHRSVKTRMEAESEDGRRYVPMAALDLEQAVWVD